MAEQKGYYIQKRGNSYRITVSVNGKKYSESYKPVETTPAKIRKEVENEANMFKNLADQGVFFKQSKSGYKITVMHEGKEYEETFIPEETDFVKARNAVRKEAEIFMMKVHAGTPLVDTEITFDEFFKYWKDNYSSGLSPRTAEENERIYLTVFKDDLYKKNEDGSKRKIYNGIGSKKLSKIRLTDMESIMNELKQKLAPATVRKYFSAVSTVFTEAVRLQKIEQNPCDNLKLPALEDNDELHTFTIEQAERFFSICENGLTVYYPQKVRKNGRIIPEHTEQLEISTQFYAYFVTSVFSGCRRGELIALTWQDVDYVHRKISISGSTSYKRNSRYEADPKNEHKFEQFDKSTKTRRGFRDIDLQDVCFDILKKWQNEQMQHCMELGTAWNGEPVRNFSQQYVFTQHDGIQMDLNTPYHTFKKILRQYNKSLLRKAAEASDESIKAFYESQILPDITLHDLRHTAASIAIAQGTPLLLLSKRLGHAKTSTTLDIYSHLLEQSDRTFSENMNKAFFGESEEKSYTLELSEEEYRKIIAERSINRA